MRVVCTQQLVWTLLSLLRESCLSTHRSVLLFNDSILPVDKIWLYKLLLRVVMNTIILPPSPHTQPILSETVLDQYRENKSSVPPGMTPDKYLEVMVS